MFSGIIGVLALGVLAVMVYNVVKPGSQGPTAITDVGKGISGFYTSLS
jgi:hypothetical protein